MGDLSTVTVIVPTRDRPNLLAAALRSVCAQHMPPREVLVVDDGTAASATEAVSAVPSTANIPLRVLEGPRMGPGAARNVGLRAAHGSLVAFLDDDDLWLPGKLARQVEALGERPSLGVVGTGCLRTRHPEEAAVRVSTRRLRIAIVSQHAMVRANRLGTSSVVGRRECFERYGGFDESLPLAQDWDMWLRISADWEIGIVPELLTVLRRHGEQRSADRLEMRRWEAVVIRRALSRGDLRGRRVQGAARRRLAWAHLRLGSHLARRGEAEPALAEIRESLTIAPLNPLAWASLVRWTLSRRAPLNVNP